MAASTWDAEAELDPAYYEQAKAEIRAAHMQAMKDSRTGHIGAHSKSLKKERKGGYSQRMGGIRECRVVMAR